MILLSNLISGNLAGGIQVQTQPCAKTKRSELLKVLDPMQNTDSSLAGSSGNMNINAPMNINYLCCNNFALEIGLFSIALSLVMTLLT